MEAGRGQKKYTENTFLGAFSLEADISQLQDVVIIAEKSTVEIKLDKRVYKNKLIEIILRTSLSTVRGLAAGT